MKKILAILVAMVVVVAFAVAAGAEEFFSPAEKAEICQLTARLLPGCGIVFHNVRTGDVGMLIGPMREGNYLFIFVSRGGEMYIYKPPAKYENAAHGVLKIVYEIIDRRPAREALGVPKELKGEMR